MFKWVSILWNRLRNNPNVNQIHPGDITSETNSRISSRVRPAPVVTNLECPICLQPVDVNVASYCKNSPCNAHYHLQCIEQWREHNRGNLTCTLCTLNTVCLRPKKRRKPKKNKKRNSGSNPRTIFIQPPEPSPRQVTRTQRPRTQRPRRHRPINRPHLTSRNNTSFQERSLINNDLSAPYYNRDIHFSINENRLNRINRSQHPNIYGLHTNASIERRLARNRINSRYGINRNYSIVV